MATCELERIMTERQYAVSRAPDTKGAVGPRVTVRPERLTVRLDGGEDGTVTFVGVWGRTVRRDGEVTAYRKVGWSTWEWDRGEGFPPAWVVALLEDEGLTWKNQQGVQLAFGQTADVER